MSNIDWASVGSDPKFQTLYRRKTRFLWGLMAFSIIYYFMLPIGAAYFQDLFRARVMGVVNFGILFALSEFVIAWAVAFVYSRRANAEFDALARDIANSAALEGATP